MTRDESLQITSMVLTHWHAQKDWTKEEIDIYARLVQDLDAELTTSAVIRAAKESPYRPTVAELRERVRIEQKRLAPVVEPYTPRGGEALPDWVKRWACARMLHDRFGKERDARRFAEQGNHADLTQEQMPEGAWDAEAESVSERDFAAAFATLLKE